MSARRTTEGRGGGRRNRAGRGDAPIAQLSWQNLQNPYAPMELATPEQIEAIHATSLRILSELGIRVLSTRVMDLFEAAGTKVDRDEGVVRMDAELVDASLQTVPSSFTLTGRNPDKKLVVAPAIWRITKTSSVWRIISTRSTSSAIRSPPRWRCPLTAAI